MTLHDIIQTTLIAGIASIVLVVVGSILNTDARWFPIAFVLLFAGKWLLVTMTPVFILAMVVRMYRENVA